MNPDYNKKNWRIPSLVSFFNEYFSMYFLSNINGLLRMEALTLSRLRLYMSRKSKKGLNHVYISFNLTYKSLFKLNSQSKLKFDNVETKLGGLDLSRHRLNNLYENLNMT